jgi:hypothetical protein
MATGNPGSADARTSENVKPDLIGPPEPSGFRVKSMSRCRRLRIPREKCPIFGGNADDRPTHNAAPVVNNRLAATQECCLTAVRTDGRTSDAAAHNKTPPAVLRVAARSDYDTGL